MLILMDTRHKLLQALLEHHRVSSGGWSDVAPPLAKGGTTGDVPSYGWGPLFPVDAVVQFLQTIVAAISLPLRRVRIRFCHYY